MLLGGGGNYGANLVQLDCCSRAVSTMGFTLLFASVVFVFHNQFFEGCARAGTFFAGHNGDGGVRAANFREVGDFAGEDGLDLVFGQIVEGPRRGSLRWRCRRKRW